jgi:flagellin-like hook-associated protein FlgL
MATVSLTAGIRANLLSLNETSTVLGQTQARIGSGKKVGSAIDDPTAFFTAQALSNRAGDLTSRLDGIGKGIQTVKAASAGVTGITSLLKQAKGIAQDARALPTSGGTSTADRAAAVTKYNAVLNEIDSMAKDSGYDGVNLLDSATLDVQFAEKAGSSVLTLTGFDASSAGTVVTAADATDWSANATIDTAVSALETSIANLQTQSKTLSANLASMTTRQTFTKSMVDTLTTGSDNLTNADLNTESANLLALNTQNSLGVNALSLASQASQSVLKLLG